MEHNGTEQQLEPAAGAAILDTLLKIEDHVATMRTLLEGHTSGAIERQRAVLAAIQGAEQTSSYYGKELVKSYHRLERLYRRLDEALHTSADLSIPVPPEPPAGD